MNQTRKMLPKEQIELGAKYLASSNTGLLGCGFPKPKTKGEIRQVFSQISYEYENETGEDLSEELTWWWKDLEKEPEQWVEKLKQEVPFIFE